jgi:hypothetical protein
MFEGMWARFGWSRVTASIKVFSSSCSALPLVGFALTQADRDDLGAAMMTNYKGLRDRKNNPARSFKSRRMV